MVDIKPSVTRDDVRALLYELFDGPIEKLMLIEGGHVARTFSFRVNEQDYVIRFKTSNRATSFKKEVYVYDHFAGPRIPIPRIVRVGQYQAFYYAISHQVPGVPLDTLPADEFAQLLPKVVETLDAIHQLEVGENANYGLFDDHGVGLFPSWRSYLTSIKEEEPEGGFYGRWHSLFESSFLERDLFDLIFDQMTRLLVHCPEERYLVHGDYGFDNVIVDDGTITGVLDWADAKYGDFVYDVAWLDLWSPDTNFKGRIHQYYAVRERAIPFYEERVCCYQCYIGLDGLRFFAKSRNHDAYQWVRARILAVLRQA